MPGASFLISGPLSCHATLVSAGRTVPAPPPVRTDRHIEAQKHLLDLHSIGIQEGPLEYGLGHLKTDKFFVSRRGVAALGGLEHIESKLRLGVRGGVV